MSPHVEPRHRLLHQLMAAVDQVSQAGTPEQLEAAREALITARRQIYRILAADLPSGAGVNNTSTKGGDAYE